MTARHGSRLGGARRSQAAMPRHRQAPNRKLHMQGGRGILSKMRLSDVAEQAPHRNGAGQV